MLWGPENGWPINRGQCRLQNGIYIFLKYCLKKLMTATCNVMVSCWIKYTKLARQWQALKPAKKSNTKMKGNQSTPNPTQVFLLHAKWLGNLPRRGRERYTTMFQALPTYLPIHPFIHWPPQSLAWRKWNRLENRLRHLQQDLLGASKLSELVSQLGHPRPNRTHFWFKKRVIQTKASNVWDRKSVV